MSRIEKIMSYAISVGVQMDSKQAAQNARAFGTAVGFAKAATQDLNKTLDIFRQVAKDYNLTAEQQIAVENRLTAAHEKRTEALKKEAAAAKQTVDAWKSGLDNLAKTPLDKDLAERRKQAAIDDQGRDAWAKGMEKVKKQNAELAQEAKKRAELLAFLSSWEGGMSKIGTTQFDKDLEIQRQGRAAWERGLNNATRNSQPAAVRQSMIDQMTELEQARLAAFQRGLENRATAKQFMDSLDTSALSRMNQRIAEANQLHRDGILGARQHATAVRMIQAEYSLAGRAIAAFRDSVLALAGPLVIVYQAYQAFISSIKASAEMDATRARFRVFMGDVESANKLLRELRALSANSPVPFASGQRAATTMLQFGVSPATVGQDTRRIAEIAGGDAQRMEALALAFGQVSAAGKLMGQELLQMVNAGFNPLKVMSEQTGVSMSELRKKMSEGEISFQMVVQAMETATSKGGRFYGLLDELAGTSAGKIQQATSAMQELQIAFGEFLEPGTMSVLGDLTQKMRDLTETLNQLKSFKLPEALRWLLETPSSAPFGDKFNFGSDMIKSGSDYVTAFTNANAERFSKASADAAQARIRMRDMLAEPFDRMGWAGVTRPQGLSNEADLAYLKQIVDFESKLNAFREGRLKATAEELELMKQFAAVREKEASAAEKEAIEKQKRQEAENREQRIGEVFSASERNAKDKLLDAQYSKNDATIIRAIQDATSGDEREKVNRLVEANASLADIMKAITEEVRKRAQALGEVLEKTEKLEKAEKDKKQAEQDAKEAAREKEREQKAREREIGQKFEEARRKYEQDLNQMKSRADEVRRRNTPQGDLTEKLAELNVLRQQGMLSQQMYQMERNRLANEAVQSMNVSAPPLALKGSQENYRLLVDQATDQQSQQLQEAMKQTILLEQANRERQLTNEKLDELINGAPVVLGP